MAALAWPAGAPAAIGDGFSFAQQTDPDSGTSAPAFPVGPDARAFWAGVCDVHGADAIVGSLPAFPVSGCIDHPAAGVAFGDEMQPPLSPGLSIPGFPDGWVRSTGELGGPGWRLADVNDAGGHPDGSASFWFSRGARGGGVLSGAFGVPDGGPRSVRVSLPPGVIADPQAVPQCPAEALVNAPASCPPKSQVGVSVVSLDDVVSAYPVYNVEPRDGKTAELVISGVGLSDVFKVNQPIVASVRTGSDFGADGSANELPAAAPFIAQTITLWGVPWAASHDRYRPVRDYCNGGGTGTDFFGGNSNRSPGMPVAGLPGGVRSGCSQQAVSYDPSWGPVKPFFATQTECSAQNPVTRIHATNWNTAVEADADSEAPLITSCEDISFPASIALDPTARRTDSPSGIDAELMIPQNNVPPAGVRFNADDDTGAPAHWKSAAGRAVSHLKDTVVTLPKGFSLNPSTATGLEACTSSQIGLTSDPGASPVTFEDDDPADVDDLDCPAASAIGTVVVETPLLEEGDWPRGEVYLAAQDDNPFASPYAIYIVVRSVERGLKVKLAGKVELDEETGQITTTFADNPQLPFDRFQLRFKAGPKAPVATPMTCNTSPDQYRAVSSLLPWSRSHLPAGTGPGTQDPVVVNEDWVIDEDCDLGFDPSVSSGGSNDRAAQHTAFSFELTRPQGDQWVDGLTVKLPVGLLAAVKNVPLCTNAEIAAFERLRAADPNTRAEPCSEASRIGVVDASAGSGDPYVLQEKGEVFFTEGYKGGPYGLLVKVRAAAGPYDLGTIVVRQKIEVDRKTARVTAISDPLPTIWEGIPLRMRRVLVKIDRPAFTLNPTGCSARQLEARVTALQGAAAERTNHFQVRGCGALPFKPKLALSLTGRKQIKTGSHPGVKAQVNQTGIGEAGIRRAEVRLPKSLALDPANAQALCEFVDGTKDDLENHCPKGSIIGRARATTPLLRRPLTGNAYFVKNVRIDPDTGNPIRTLPMIVVALRGEIAINLKGESSTTKSGKLVNTFAAVPDAPITQFNLKINGGKNGILAVTRTRRSNINLCKAGRQVAEVDMDGHNGRNHDFDVAMRKPCPKRKVKSKRG